MFRIAKFAIAFLLVGASIANAEDSATSEVQLLSVSIVGNQPMTFSGISDGSPIVVEVKGGENSLVTIALNLNIDHTFGTVSVSSDINDFIVAADLAKTVSSNKNEVTLQLQSDSAVIHAYGKIPQGKSVFNLLKISSNTLDILNLIGNLKEDAQNGSKDTPTQDQDAAAIDEVNSHPLLIELNSAIEGSSVQDKNLYRLKVLEVQSLIEQGQHDNATKLAGQILQDLKNQEAFQTDQGKQCERSRLKILDAEDRLSATFLPQENMQRAVQLLDFSKKAQQNGLCDVALEYASQALQQSDIGPIERLTYTYPWLTPVAIVSALGVAATAAIRRMKANGMIGGLGHGFN